MAIATDDNDSAGARRTNFAAFLGRCEELGLPPPFSLAEAVAFEDPQIFGGAIMAMRKLTAVPEDNYIPIDIWISIDIQISIGI